MNWYYEPPAEELDRIDELLYIQDRVQFLDEELWEECRKEIEEMESMKEAALEDKIFWKEENLRDFNGL